MLNKNEIKVLKLLMAKIRKELTISDISRLLKQKYAQTYLIVKKLMAKKLVKVKKIGKSNVVLLDFNTFKPDYIIAEIERLKDKLKNKDILLVYESVKDLDIGNICILFGSYASGKQKKSSDIDLLFIVNEDISRFERKAKNSLSHYNADINVITKESLFEMWSSNKLNVGNEVLENHIILYGSEQFIALLRRRYERK
ncbi:hypothetical protein GF323_01490 [Candidatus Woesearchaeota archaeon]|nr:hypothetical protein [Candidatus Woesearchaeota archaeon]